MNFKQIIEGWRNHLMPSKDMKQLIEDVSNERLSLCLNCPYNSTCGEITSTSYCKACGCNLKAKSKCLSCECGIQHADSEADKLWVALTTQEEKELIEKQIKEHKDETS